MKDEREKKAKLNIMISLGCQIIALICGIITPQLMINRFGSEAYGATTSISQFLSYITLLEGGIGGVARAVLYKPLAENDTKTMNSVVYEIASFFRVVAYIFLIYVLVIACAYKRISRLECLDWVSTFALVIVISISTFGQYYIGISNSIFLQAAQKSYITNIISIATRVINTIAILFLVNMEVSLIVVKFVSSLVFLIRPLALKVYVDKNYKIVAKKNSETVYLTQKWTGLSQHIAFFLHTNTDIVLLTCFTNLTNVAIYSVYSMITSNIKNVVISFASGMEAMFGDMLAKNEDLKLQKAFSFYESMISIVATILFSSTVVLVIPFIKLYTENVNDANYIEPIFALFLILAEYLYCLRLPYHSVVIAAGHFKETSSAAYGETAINIVVSLVLVTHCGLIGVVFGTFTATLFRFIFYIAYLSKNILRRKCGLFVRRMIINTIIFIGNILIGFQVVGKKEITGYGEWIACAAIVVICSLIFTMVIYAKLYSDDLKSVIRRIIIRKRKSNTA